MPKKIAQSRTAQKKKKSSPQLPQLVGLALAALALSLGLIFGLQQLQRNQDTRQQAASAAAITLRTQGQNPNSGELRIDLLLNSYTYSIAGTQITATLTGVSSSDVSIDTSNSLSLETVKNTVTAVSNGARVELVQFASTDPNRPATTSNREVKIASIVVRRSGGGTATITFNSQSTAIPVLGSSTVRLDLQSGSRSYTITTGSTSSNNRPVSDDQRKGCDQNCATDPECKSNLVCYKGRCRLPAVDKREDSTCAATPDRGLQRTCNQYCADSKECASGYSCYYNRCRNPRNLLSESCANPASPRPVALVTDDDNNAPYTGGVGSSTGTASGTRATPSPSVSPVPTPLPSPSPSPTPIASPLLSPSPVASVRPAPSASPAPASTSSGRYLRAGLILLFALGIVIPVGVYLYRKVG